MPMTLPYPVCRRRTILAVALALAASLPAAAAERWVPIGPEGGTVGALAVDPRSRETLYAGTGGASGGAGVFKSTDGGASWAQSPGLAEGTVLALAIDPRRPSTVYASTGSLWKSLDGGARWRPLPATSRYASVTTIAVSPLDSALFVGTDEGVVYRSVDGGRHWLRRRRGLPASGKLSDLTIDPRHPATLYVGAFDVCAIYKSIDSGANWAPRTNGLGCPYPGALALDPASPRVLYAASTPGPLAKSVDGAASWFPSGAGLPSTAIVQAIAVSPTEVYAGTTEGLFASADAGRTWTRRGLATRSVVVLATPRGPGAPVYAGLTDLGVFASTDGGETFRERNHGLVATEVAVLALGPALPSTLYAGSAQGTIWRTTDGGESWQVAGRAPRPNTNFGSSLAVDPARSSVLYAGFPGGIAQSLDSGETWTDLSDPSMVEVDVDSILVDPRSSATLYTTGQELIDQDQLGCVAFKSYDQGHRWTCPDSNVYLKVVFQLVVDPLDSATLYACAEEGLFKSADGGLTWRLADPTQKLFPIALVADPAHAGTLYGTDGTFALMKSADTGLTWASITDGLPPGSPGALALDPGDESAVYVLVRPFGSPTNPPAQVFRSRDAGATWSAAGSSLPPIASYPFPPMIVDPRRPGLLYVGTSGHGVYALAQ